MEIRRTTQFKKDMKRIMKGQKASEVKAAMIDTILPALQAGRPLEEKYQDHALKGDWVPARECHVFPDILLVYRVEGDCLVLIRIGSHAGLFG